VQSTYLKRALELAEGTWEPEDVTKPPVTHWDLKPTLQDVEEYLTDPQARYGLAVDIETAGEHLLCIGFARLADEECLCVPFRKQYGEQYWPTRAELREAAILVAWVLGNEDIPKCFQNGQGFDVPMLESWGFTVKGYSFDTMLCQRYMYPEMPANLQFIANLYGKIPPWKWVLKQEENK
jgi:hypothetical protein